MSDGYSGGKILAVMLRNASSFRANVAVWSFQSLCTFILVSGTLLLMMTLMVLLMTHTTYVRAGDPVANNPIDQHEVAPRDDVVALHAIGVRIFHFVDDKQQLRVS
eukprot:2254824-Amphidinium_carterae.1